MRPAVGRRGWWPLVLAAALIGVGAANPADAGWLVAGGGDLDRIALAVDGVESSYDTDPLMWRADRNGPQGPMQVSAAAATDAGGGNRFDTLENHALGRAYLSSLYRRYSNWPDAVAAYNWGPGNVDAWIGRGRSPLDMPATVALYRARVITMALYGPADLGVPRFWAGHRQPRRSLADLRHPGRASIAVERLYGAIMQLGALEPH
jgi:Transglycosylase SLT domain